MIISFFYTVFYNPIYNALVSLVAFVPSGDVGVAVIILTILIRIALLPFSLAAVRTQRAMKGLEPKLKELKERNKGNREKEAIETLALYKEEKIKPFSSILMLFIQIPVLLALYLVFFYEPFSTINTARLYSLTPYPSLISLEFFGIISVAGKSIMLALIAGASQYIQAHMALLGTMKPSLEKGMQQDFQRIMGLQLKYVFPFLIAIISYTTSGAVALYFITTNLVGSLQEFYVRRTIHTENQNLERVAPQ